MRVTPAYRRIATPCFHNKLSSENTTVISVGSRLSRNFKEGRTPATGNYQSVARLSSGVDLSEAGVEQKQTHH